MQLTIPPDLQALIEKRIATGAYETPEDVLRRALEAQDEDESLTEEERQAISDHIDEGFEQAERGELIDGDQARREIAQYRQQRIRAHQAE
jgi:antitoxin ParD1/3/4